MYECIVQKQTTVNAPKRTVWETLTNPDLTEKYFYGCRVDSTFKAGAPIAFKRKILWLFPFELAGKILKIDLGSSVKYSLKNSKATSESTVSIELHDEGEKTLVYIMDDVGAGRRRRGSMHTLG